MRSKTVGVGSRSGNAENERGEVGRPDATGWLLFWTWCLGISSVCLASSCVRFELGLAQHPYVPSTTNTFRHRLYARLNLCVQLRESSLLTTSASIYEFRKRVETSPALSRKTKSHFPEFADSKAANSGKAPWKDQEQ